MARTPRRWPALLVGAASFVGLGLLMTAAAASTTGPSSPTVRFQPEDDGNCATVPDHRTSTVPAGTQVVFVNQTGHDGTVLVGDQSEQVNDGAGVGLTIAIGQYDVRLVDGCGSVAVSQPVALTVTAASSATPTDAGAADTVSPTASAAPTDTSASPAGTGTVAPTSGGALPSRAKAVVSAGRTPTPQSAPVPARSPVLAVTPVGLDNAGANPKDVRLLAVVATICVLGVTAAIIRSIVRLSP
jgi:hypothetical protein